MGWSSSESERHTARYIQNSENFRGLNAQMWQIPIIGMTLTGGLWFGVSNVKDSPAFQLSLLVLAAVGNFALIFVLFRIRFVMSSYLNWINENEPKAVIRADGKRFYEKSFFVRTVFQFVLGLTAFISIALAVAPGQKFLSARTVRKIPFDAAAIAHAEDRAIFSFAAAHPNLARTTFTRSQNVLVFGSGAARDAEALRQLGHRVTVVALSKLDETALKTLSPVPIISSALPALKGVPRTKTGADLIIGNDVWAVMDAAERSQFLEEIGRLLAPGGRLELTLRIGPSPTAGQPPITEIGLSRRLAGTDLSVFRSDPLKDLLNRPDMEWKQITVVKRQPLPAPKAPSVGH